MKVLHIAPNAPYNDNWGYQDNLLPKYQKREGHDVFAIVTDLKRVGDTLVHVKERRYVLPDGVVVYRLERKKYLFSSITNLAANLKDIYKTIVEIKPDFIFFHGLVSLSIFSAIKYKKRINNKCIIVQDNHLDYRIGMSTVGIKEKFRHVWHIIVNKRSQKYVAKIYGVTPWRKQYAYEYFKIQQKKLDVLIMGADDDYLDFGNKNSIRETIRAHFSIRTDDFLIVSGGKLDKNKNIVPLMRAVNNVKGVKLLLFGSVSQDIAQEFETILKNSQNIIFIGWVDSSNVYNYFFSADLVFFPGQHSVLWEQACASKVPCVFKKWDGMEHVNNGGNAVLLDECDSKSITVFLNSFIGSPYYFNVKKIAESNATDIYLYSRIAKKSLEMADTIK